MASYEEDAPNLVNNLVPEPTPKEKRDTNKMEESKTTADRRNLIEIKDKTNWNQIRIQNIPIRFRQKVF